jgi:hypothetical protein
MNVRHEIKSQLAKLLATEDLIVENKKVETAQFNVHTRVLTLPNWDRASNNVYDALVAHEVGHALFTPDRDWWEEIKISPSIVNIVEDARVEKLMKRKYAGIAKTFYNGYNELFDNDFFEIDGKDLSTFNLADRVNLYFKVGAWVDISFSPIETSIVNLIKNAETFDQTLSAAEALHNYCQQEQEQEQSTSPETDKDSGVDDSSGGSTDSTSDTSDTDSSDVEGDADTDYRISDATDSVGGTTGSDEIEVETASSLEDALKGLTDVSQNGRENAYVELPKVDLKNVIINNKKLHAEIEEYWINEEEDWEEHFKLAQHFNVKQEDRFDDADDRFREFKRNSQKEVNYLVKEFECKKSADAYARATTAKTGILDTARLHTYKYNEDLFKKVTVIPDGKNHGLVFILDWSGSMAHVMLDTLKQLYNLLWFCKKVNIPFEVYAFTNEYPDPERKPFYEKKEGFALIDETFSLMNLFTSKVKGKVLEDQMKNIFRIACLFNRDFARYNIPIGLNLSGTPLNESLISLHQIIPQFQKQNKIQKVQCVVLTDGEGSPLRYSQEFKRSSYYGEDYASYMGSQSVERHCYIRNRRTGHVYPCSHIDRYSDVTTILIEDLKQSFPSTNFIGFRILPSREAGHFIRQHLGYGSEKYEKMMRVWKKEKSFTIDCAGYHSYFGLSSSAIDNDAEFEVDLNATKAQIKRAFTKSLKGKKMNKKILGEFIELVA